MVLFEAVEAGRYAFECSRLCGAGHNFMRGAIVVEDRAAVAGNGDAAAARGRGTSGSRERRRIPVSGKAVVALPAVRRAAEPRLAVGLATLALAVLAAGVTPAPAQLPAPRLVLPGDPLPGLTPVEFEEFMLGLDDFLEVEDAEEGLGPAYNNTSCAGCHNVPAIGGIAPMTTTRAGIRGPDGAYRDIEPGRGSLFQIFSIPTHACQSVIPPEANVIAKAGSDSAVRRRPDRGDSRRGARGARRSGRPRPRRRQRAGSDRSSIS